MVCTLSPCLSFFSQRFEVLDGHRPSTPYAILSVSLSKEFEGHADVTVRVADKDVPFQVQHHETVLCFCVMTWN